MDFKRVSDLGPKGPLLVKPSRAVGLKIVSGFQVAGSTVDDRHPV